MLYRLECCFGSTHIVPFFSGHPVYINTIITVWQYVYISQNRNTDRVRVCWWQYFA